MALQTREWPIDPACSDDLAQGAAISLRRSLRRGDRAIRPDATAEATALRAFDILRNLTRQ